MDDVLKSVTDIFTSIRDQIASSSPAQLDHIAVPKFDPDERDLDEWITEIEKFITDFKWSSRETVAKIATCLVGPVKHWYDNWQPPSGIGIP